MSPDTETELGFEAIEYIRECLAEGKTLARHLLERADLSSGRVTTLLPSNVRMEEISQFRTGLGLERDPATFRYHTAPDGSITRLEPKFDPDPSLLPIIEAFLRAAPGHLCIVENGLARPSDPSLSRYQSHLLIFADEVYHFLSPGDWQTTTIAQTLKEARHVYPPLVAVLASGAEEIGLSEESREITSIQLSASAERAEKIIVGAYDGEGYLIWTRPSP